MTYVEALGEFQQRSLDALKVARSSQIASLKTTRVFAQTLVERRPYTFAAPMVMRAMTELTTAFAFALFDQQVAFAKKLTDTLAKPPVSVRRLAPLLAIATAPPMLTTTATLDTRAEPDVIAGMVSTVVADAVSTVPADAMLTVTDDALSTVTGDALSTVTGAAILTVPDDALSTVTDAAILTVTDDALSTVTGDALSTVTDDALSTVTDDAVSETTGDAIATVTDDGVSEATGYAMSALTGDVAATVSEYIAQPLTEPSDAAAAESDLQTFADACTAEPSALARPSQALTDEVLPEMVAASKGPSVSNTFPVSSGNGARKPPKSPNTSNNRPKQKRNPGK